MTIDNIAASFSSKFPTCISLSAYAAVRREYYKVTEQRASRSCQDWKWMKASAVLTWAVAISAAFTAAWVSDQAA